MEKKEILEKSRKENFDERVNSIKDKSIKWTYITMVLVAGIFAYIRASRGETIYDLCVTVCASVTVGQIFRFIELKEKQYLIIGLISAAAMILGIVRFVMGY